MAVARAAAPESFLPPEKEEEEEDPAPVGARWAARVPRKTTAWQRLQRGVARKHYEEIVAELGPGSTLTPITPEKEVI